MNDYNNNDELVTELSFKLISSTAGNKEKVIIEVLQRLTNYFEIDRSYVILLRYSGVVLDYKFEWHKDQIESRKDQAQMHSDNFPWMMGKLNNSEIIRISKISDLPTDSERDSKLLINPSLKSLLIIPLVYKENLIGFIGFDSIKQEKMWNKYDNLIFQRLGKIITAFFIRIHEEIELETENRGKLEWIRDIDLILNCIPVGLIGIDREGNILFANKQAKLFYAETYQNSLTEGTSCLLLESNGFFSVLKEIYFAEHSLTLFHEMKRGLNLRFDSLFLHSDNNDHLSNIISISDVTEFIEFEKVRNRILSNITHELRTPITIILQSINNLENYYFKIDEKSRFRLFDAIARNSDLLSKHIESLLFISEIEDEDIDLEWKKYYPHKILKNILRKKGEIIIEKSLNVKMEVSDQLYLYGDTQKIEQLFDVIIENAIKYTEHSKDIIIKASELSKNQTSNELEDCIHFQFVDFGIGIEENSIPHLFEPLFRGENAKDIQGTGLGLYIAQELVILHGGKINIESNIVKGTLINIFLPKSKKRIKD